MNPITDTPGQRDALTGEHDRDALRRRAIYALTAAARERVDFADLIAGVLAAVAANVGSTDRLLSGRPGSWEADLVRRLIAGTVGHDDEYILAHRTAEVVVSLNVLDLPWQVPGFPDVEAALDQVYARFAGIPDADYDTDRDTAAEWAAEDAVLDAYATTYAHYAQQFTAAVTDAAASLDGLTVPVRVVAVHDPRRLYGSTTTPVAGEGHDVEPSPDEVRNPTQFDDPVGADPIAVQLWETAFAATPNPAAPNVSVADPRPAAGTRSEAESADEGGAR